MAVLNYQPHPDALAAFLRDVAPREASRAAWTETDGPLPTMFLSHGAPPLLDDTGWMTDLFGWAHTLPQPRAILIVSAHWEDAPLSLSDTAAGVTPVYDFGGFASRYYALRYDTPDASELAAQVRAVLPRRQELHEHRSRGLDHGAWVPLKVMYPNARVPVLQMSLPSSDPHQLLALGSRLRPLREQGVLVVGSGFMTHGRQYLTPQNRSGETVADWSSEFDAWARGALARGAVEELAGYRASAPGMPYAHPTVEHFTPLFVTLGAASDPESVVTPTISGYWFGLSKLSFQAA